MQFTLNYDTVAAGTSVSFVLRNVFNPPSTAPVTATAASFIDVDGNSLLSFSGTYPVIQPTSPATVIVQELKLDDSSPGATTGVTITFSTINQMPVSGAAITIKPPSSATLSGSVTCSVKIGVQTYTPTSCSVSSGRVVVVGNYPGQIEIIPGFLPGSTTISVHFGTITNNAAAAGSRTPSSFVVTTYTDSSLAYSIDTIQDGLYLSTCGTGFYLEKGICAPCFSKCLTCSTRNLCLSCETTAASNNYLLNGQCWTTVTIPA